MNSGFLKKEDYPKWLDRNEYPFKTRFHRLSAGKMHFVDEGLGEPIVMVHGNPGWSFEYRNIIKKARETRRCIAPDHLGFGLSDKPDNFDYLPSSHAKNFEELINSLALEKITFVFNDWGGPIALAYAIKYPQKIKKLVIMNTYLWSVVNDPHYQKFSGFMGGPVGKFLIVNFNFFAKIFLKQVFGDKTKLPKNIHRHYYMHLNNKRERKGCYIFPREVTASGEWLDSLWQQKEKINAIPTSIVWGMKDIAFRENELNCWIENWQNPKVIKLSNTGHYPQEETPEAVIQEILSD